MEATILKWHKQAGDTVKQDETILDIATDKVDSEVPSTAEGVIESILYNVNDVVPIGTVIATIRIAGEATPSAPITNQYEEAKLVEEIPYQPAKTITASNTGNAVRFYSPLVLNIAQQEGIGMAELENIPGTGQDGRVSKKDILAYVAARGSNKPVQEVSVVRTENRAVNPSLPVTQSENVAVIMIYNPLFIPAMLKL
jgi:2-oxoglutarate dehydrogenase E2 component (dihydrolipoamide succinyltransferase)